jgi:hypothetical protein
VANRNLFFQGVQIDGAITTRPHAHNLAAAARANQRPDAGPDLRGNPPE